MVVVTFVRDFCFYGIYICLVHGIPFCFAQYCIFHGGSVFTGCFCTFLREFLNDFRGIIVAFFTGFLCFTGCDPVFPTVKSFFLTGVLLFCRYIRICFWLEFCFFSTVDCVFSGLFLYSLSRGDIGIRTEYAGKNTGIYIYIYIFVYVVGPGCYCPP